MGAAVAIEPLPEQPTEVPERRLSPAEEARLVRENQGLVHFFARRQKTTSYDDAVQAGMIGLLIAIRKFEPERGLKLSTYAQYWIRQAIDRQGFAEDPKGDTPNLARTRYKIREATKQLKAEGVERPTIAQVGERAKIFPATVAAALEWRSAHVSSLDAPIGEDDGAALVDMVPDDGAGPESVVAESEAMAMLRKQLDCFSRMLPPREAIVLKERLLAEQPSGQREVGERIKRTKQRVQQLETTVLDKLQKYMRRVHREDFDVRAALAAPVTKLRPQSFGQPIEALLDRPEPAPVRSVPVAANAVSVPAAKARGYKVPTCAKCGAPLSVRSLQQGYDRCGVCRQRGPEKHQDRAIPDNPVSGSGRARAPGTGNVWHKKGRWYAKEPESIQDGRRFARYIGSFATAEEAHAACDKWVEENGGPKVERVLPTCNEPGCSTFLNQRSLEAGDGLCGVHRRDRKKMAERAKGEVVAGGPSAITALAVVDRGPSGTEERTEPAVDTIASVRAFLAKRDELRGKLESELQAAKARVREIEDLLAEFGGSSARPIVRAERTTAPSARTERRQLIKEFVINALGDNRGPMKGAEVVHIVQRIDSSIHHTSVYQALYALHRERRICADDGQNRYWLRA